MTYLILAGIPLLTAYATVWKLGGWRDLRDCLAVTAIIMATSCTALWLTLNRY